MGARAPPHKQASVLRPTPAIVRGRPRTTRGLINSLTTRPPSRDSSAHLIPEREGGGGGGRSESQSREYPRRTRVGGKARREIQGELHHPSRSPALGSDPRFRARLPDRAGNPQRAGGAHGSLVQYAIPRAGGEARHAKGERMEGGEYACSFFF